MGILRRLLLLGIGVLLGSMSRTAGEGLLPASSALQTASTTNPVLPRTVLAPGLRPWPDFRTMNAEPPAQSLPDGFTSIFNGRTLAGWHVSETAAHGLTPDFHVSQGMIIGAQQPLGSGGLLLTNRNYRNFELYMEVKPDWGNDSGIFFRTTNNGAAYQITMDYIPGGSMGRLIGEGGIEFGGPARPQGQPDPGMSAWKRDEWNIVRVRVVGDIPRATVWINDQQVSDARDTENHAVGGMLEGPIAIQIHGGVGRWQPGGFWRWRNIAIKELPNDER
jgi:Domain of Unknown Function (DUF1080)